jgi:hypothetical protein
VGKLITLALESQHHEISSEFHQQKITTLRNIQKILTPCFGKITHYALCRAQNEFDLIKWSEELGKCNHSFTVQTGIPCKHWCKHWISYLVNCGKQIEPTEFHTQWHMKVSSPFSLFVFIFFLPFFFLFPILFSLFPISFPFFGGFGGVWIGYPYCHGVAGCCKATLLFFEWGSLIQKVSFFLWGLLIQKICVCNVLGVVNVFDFQTGGRQFKNQPASNDLGVAGGRAFKNQPVCNNLGVAGKFFFSLLTKGGLLIQKLTHV